MPKIRTEKLEAALRENLKRRKAQAALQEEKAALPNESVEPDGKPV